MPEVFVPALSFKSFGNAGHDRDGGFPHLVTQSKVAGKCAGVRAFVDFVGQNTSPLPNFQVLEPLNTAHDGSFLDLKRCKLKDLPHRTRIVLPSTSWLWPDVMIFAPGSNVPLSSP